jgi:hypothetical protein
MRLILIGPGVSAIGTSQRLEVCQQCRVFLVLGGSSDVRQGRTRNSCGDCFDRSTATNVLA